MDALQRIRIALPERIASTILAKHFELGDEELLAHMVREAIVQEPSLLDRTVQAELSSDSEENSVAR